MASDAHQQAERGIPCYDGQPTKWREYEKRAMMFIAKLKLQEKEQEAGLLLATGLSGDVWTEDDAVDIAELSAKDSGTKLMKVLRARFVKKLRTELSAESEAFFVSFRRERQEKLHAYVSRFRAAERKVAEHSVTMPEPVLAWMLLRRSALDEQATALIMSQVGGNDMKMTDMIDALETTFGQDSVVKGRER